MITFALLCLFVLASCACRLRTVITWVIPLSALCPPGLSFVLVGSALEPLLVVVGMTVVRLTLSGLAGTRRRSAERPLPRQGPSALSWCLAVLLLFILVMFLLHRDNEGALATTQRIVVQVVGACSLIAYTLRRGVVSWEDIASAWLKIGIVVGGLGVVEFALNQYVISGSPLGLFREAPRDGRVRAQAILAHPIIFGVLGAVVVGLASGRNFRMPLTWFLAGSGFLMILASGSRGPLLTLAAVGIAVPALVAVKGIAVRSAMLIGASIFVLYTAVSLRDEVTYVGGFTEQETSVQYRRALIGSAIDALGNAPFGFGPGQLPGDSLLVPSRYGLIDLSASVDNAYLLFLLQYGLIGGMLLALALLLTVIFAARRLQSTGERVGFTILLIILASGASVSIVSWPPTCLLLGTFAAIAIVGGDQRVDALETREGVAL